MAISFTVQGHPTSRDQWVALGRRAEDLGYDAISTSDHPGTTAAPFVALAVVAQATSRLRLASSVVNAGVVAPLTLAIDVATLDELSDGRVILGIGAGHTPGEWTAVGRAYPTATQRIEHLIVVVDAVTRLLAGETVTVENAHVCLHEAALRWPTGPRHQVPPLVGGNARRLITFGAQRADIVELTGLGRTLADGHRHEPDWSPASIDARVELFRRASAGRPAQLSALVQKVEITSDRMGAAGAYRATLSELLPEHTVPSIETLLDTPFVLIGTVDEIVAQLRRHAARWGFSRYTIRADVLDEIGIVIDGLRN
jgi:probable F420-dependent oxidoreductase